MHTFCKFAISFVFAAPSIRNISWFYKQRRVIGLEGSNFKTLAQELGQFEYSYLGEKKLVKIPREE